MIWHPDDGDLPELPDGMVWQTLEEAEEELETWLSETAKRVQRRLDLLAWLLRQAHDPKPLQDAAHWPPDLLLFNWPDTWALVRQDQDFHDLARWQIVGWRRNTIGCEDGETDGQFSEADFDEEYSSFDFITDFLATDRPGQGGKEVGRRGTIYLVKAIAAELNECASWPEVRWHPEFGDATQTSVAAAISERLVTHPTLREHPSACLTADAIRAILRA